MKEKAVEYFKTNNSCSESIIRAASEEGLCPKELLSVATAFCGGLSSGCVCGTIAAAQLINGYNFGRENALGNEVIARQNAKAIVDEFKKRNKVTCCRILSGGLEGPARKERCAKYVADVCEIIEDIIKTKVK